MKIQTISDIYETNDRVRAKLRATVENLSDAQASTLADGEKWTIREFVEHIAIVDEGIMKISAKLLSEARAAGKTAAGEAVISPAFLEKTAAARGQKIEAPDRVKPTGTVSVADSLARLDATREKFAELKPLFETVECADFKFPHPAFGPMSAHEWLLLAGGHQNRHIEQIEKVLAKL